MPQNTIYYFSGTGNSLFAAKQIGKAIGDTLLVNMKTDPSKYPSEDAEVIGFAFPVYMEGLPGGCAEFINKLRINPNAYIFALATCGRRAGNCYAELNKILNEKGAKLSYWQTAVTVANYINMYPLATNPAKRLPMLDDAIKAVITAIKGRTIKDLPANNAVMAMNHRTVRFTPLMAKLYRVTGKCNGCGICEKVCPSKTIKMVNGKPKWGKSCRQCVACIQFCPLQAIEFGISTMFRTRYHHPDISAADIAQEMFIIE
jgi:ferredoxin